MLIKGSCLKEKVRCARIRYNRKSTADKDVIVAHLDYYSYFQQPFNYEKRSWLTFPFEGVLHPPHWNRRATLLVERRSQFDFPFLEPWAEQPLTRKGMERLWSIETIYPLERASIRWIGNQSFLGEGRRESREEEWRWCWSGFCKPKAMEKKEKRDTERKDCDKTA